MDSMVYEYIEAYTTYEQKELYTKLYSYLVDYYKYNELGDILINIVLNEDLPNPVDDIYTCFNKHADSVLEQYTIKVSEDTTLRFKVDLLDTLITLESIEDKELVTNVLDSEENVVDALATLLSLVGTETIEAYLLNIEEVDVSLIKRLKELNVANEDDYSAYSLPDEKRLLFKRYVIFTHDEYGPLRKYIQADLPLHLDFTFYLTYLQNEEIVDKDEYCKSIVGSLIISNAKDTLVNTLRYHLEDLATTPRESIELEQQCRLIINDFLTFNRKAELKG